VAHWDQERGEVVHRALNSCLVPVCFVDGMEVTTVEGLGSTRSGKLHPVQDKMANLFGSQWYYDHPLLETFLYIPSARARDFCTRASLGISRTRAFASSTPINHTTAASARPAS
jgi:xanthine dehydrogenase iron-sulfur cluster and FAD-binding subunit A